LTVDSGFNWIPLPFSIPLLLLLGADRQLVFDRKDAGHSLHPDIGKVAISLAVHHTLERHVAILDDDVD
jgi:hypothetical protein